MKIEITRFSSTDEELIRKAKKIRRLVFMVEQKVKRSDEVDGYDNDAQHYLVFADNQPVATARWRKTEEGIKLERFAVLRIFRDMGVGSRILARMIKDVHTLHDNIYLNAQVDAVKFYQKRGFKKVGKKFLEAEILHFKMVFQGVEEPSI